MHQPYPHRTLETLLIPLQTARGSDIHPEFAGFHQAPVRHTIQLASKHQRLGSRAGKIAPHQRHVAQYQFAGHPNPIGHFTAQPQQLTIEPDRFMIHLTKQGLELSRRVGHAAYTLLQCLIDQLAPLACWQLAIHGDDRIGQRITGENGFTNHRHLPLCRLGIGAQYPLEKCADLSDFRTVRVAHTIQAGRIQRQFLQHGSHDSLLASNTDKTGKFLMP